jgi:cyclopropane-fatty-acyl-phospholipid synthase
MATQGQLEATYDYMDDLFRLSVGENADITGAMYGGDFSKTLEQAQNDKHEYILRNIHFTPGMKVLDIGCGWGPLLKAIKQRGGNGIGLTLSAKQAAACRRSGYEVYLRDWKTIDVTTFGPFGGIACVGALEHFCSEEEYLAGQQDQIYAGFFRSCHDLMLPAGRLFLQTMLWGKRAPAHRYISLDARKGSDEYIVAVLKKFYPGSWLPETEEQIVRTAEPHFKLVTMNNGREDYIETMTQWSKRLATFSIRKLAAMLRLWRYMKVDADFCFKLESIRGSYNQECLKRGVIDHQRMVFERC